MLINRPAEAGAQVRILPGSPRNSGVFGRRLPASRLICPISGADFIARFIARGIVTRILRDVHGDYRGACGYGASTKEARRNCPSRAADGALLRNRAVNDAPEPWSIGAVRSSSCTACAFSCQMGLSVCGSAVVHAANNHGCGAHVRVIVDRLLMRVAHFDSGGRTALVEHWRDRSAHGHLPRTGNGTPPMSGGISSRARPGERAQATCSPSIAAAVGSTMRAAGLQVIESG